MNIEQIINWLYHSAPSVAIREAGWAVPTAQCIHIAAIATLVGGSLVIDLRLAGLLAVDERESRVVRRYLPWMWGALATLLLTGAMLALAEPYRVFAKPVFWLKMGFVLLAFALTMLFRRPMLDSRFEVEPAQWRILRKPVAWLSLGLWVAAIYCGRWIAYT